MKSHNRDSKNKVPVWRKGVLNSDHSAGTSEAGKVALGGFGWRGAGSDRAFGEER